MHQPKTMDELIDLVHQAVYEVDELRACVEDEPEEMERYLPFIDQLDVQLRKLFDDMTRGATVVLHRPTSISCHWCRNGDAIFRSNHF